MSNEIPILAVIIETIIAICMIILTVRTIQKFFQRKRKPTLYLSLSFLFLSLGVGASALGKWINFYHPSPSPLIDYAGGWIVIAYTVTAIANVFLFAFLDEVFLNLGGISVALSGIANGITVGCLIVINRFQDEVYSETQPYVIYHAALSLITFGLLAFFAFREAAKSDQAMPKVGFVLIGFYGVFVSSVFVLFALDLIMPEGYSPFYYAAWISAGVGVFCGYLGYIFPDWLKKFLKLS